MGVNVLEVMDAEIDALGWQPMVEARAAVAELIEAAQDVIDGTVNATTYPDGPCIDRKDRTRLIAALARCNGGAA